MHAVAKSLRAIMDEVTLTFLERDAAIEAIMLAILSKQHAYILGPPGTGKSQLVRAIVERITDSSYFEQIMSKQRADAAVFGPYDLPLLKQGEFKRKVNGFLPTANFAFLDEIGKISPTLGHDLLAALNERVLHQVNGTRSAMPLPLYSVFTASNELIMNESDDAAALWDRLLIRVVVDYVVEPGNFANLLTSTSANPVSATTVDFADLADAIDNEVPAVVITQDVVDAVMRLREELRSAGITPSDRRWKQSMRVIQASAFLNGRSQTNEDDVRVLRFTLWDGPEQIAPVERLVLSVSNPLAEQCLKLAEELEAINSSIRDSKGEAATKRAGRGAEANSKLKVIERQAKELHAETVAAGRSTQKIDEVLGKVNATRRTIYVDCLGVADPDLR